MRRTLSISIPYIDVSFDYTCECGVKIAFSMQMPEGLNFNGQIHLNTECPDCGGQVIMPHGRYYIDTENHRLLTS